MNNYNIRLSFDKLESFDMHRSSLTSFVLIRNSLISALTRQQNAVEIMYEEPQHQLQEEKQEEDYELSDEEEQEVWLDSCFDQLDQDEDNSKPLFDDCDSEEDDEDEAMPLSPQESIIPFYKKKPTFFINEDEEEEEDALMCYDIPFLSL
ncbi:Transcriptional regulator of nonfermentable carbon utilization [Mucor velutinosus]|uniref:Transcriptional regulator of nonfermentable carbon utilization n=1 Tax=Mucor velutinosus TaxID=708070 RepID=A0AAN7DKJ8_9FUNG|nr:Transcriptional regulator of nonfermentable carbon utilization [Mucor velutinosus]